MDWTDGFASLLFFQKSSTDQLTGVAHWSSVCYVWRVWPRETGKIETTVLALHMRDGVTARPREVAPTRCADLKVVELVKSASCTALHNALQHLHRSLALSG